MYPQLKLRLGWICGFLRILHLVLSRLAWMENRALSIPRPWFISCAVYSSLSPALFCLVECSIQIWHLLVDCFLIKETKITFLIDFISCIKWKVVYFSSLAILKSKVQKKNAFSVCLCCYRLEVYGVRSNF